MLTPATPSTVPAALRTPDVAWPTILLSSLVGVAFFVNVGLGLAGVLPLWVCTLAGIGIGYLAFTPLHDASHQSIAKARWVNAFFGRMAAFILGAPFPAFRFLHLEHHKHTNDPVHDPDFYSGRGPLILLPLRWLTQDLHYRFLFFGAHARTHMRPGAWWEAAISEALLVGFWAALVGGGYGIELLLLWLLPARLAVGLLAFAFDWVPHFPYVCTVKENRFLATRVFEGPLMVLVSQAQSYHLVHHFYPGIPFYQYPAAWRERRDLLLKSGARVVGWKEIFVDDEAMAIKAKSSAGRISFALPSSS